MARESFWIMSPSCLNRPKYPGNIGSVARCAKNMGIENILVVSDVDFDEEKIRQMSTHLAADVVDRIRYKKDLREALAGFQYVVATTARVGRATAGLPDAAGGGGKARGHLPQKQGGPALRSRGRRADK